MILKCQSGLPESQCLLDYHIPALHKRLKDMTRTIETEVEASPSQGSTELPVITSLTEPQSAAAADAAVARFFTTV